MMLLSEWGGRRMKNAVWEFAMCTQLLGFCQVRYVEEQLDMTVLRANPAHAFSS